VVIGHGSSETDSKVNLNGFGGTTAQGGFIQPVVADVNGTLLSIARQNPDGTEPDGSKYYVSGDATFDPATSKIVMTYKFERDSAGVITNINCAANYTKQ
jgi:hypothetical protein